MKLEMTNEVIAANWDLWREYVDPSGIGTREEFDAQTIAEKVAFIERCFPENRPTVVYGGLKLTPGLWAMRSLLGSGGGWSDPVAVTVTAQEEWHNVRVPSGYVHPAETFGTDYQFTKLA